MFNSDRNDSNFNHNTKNKNSKQKILQLKEELNKGIVDFDPKFEKLKVLRECYDITRNRLNEFLLTTNKNLYVQANTNRASKIYSAMSTLIYTSICCSKCDELESFIRKSAASVPSGVIDLDEWNSILKIARDCREGSNTNYLINENNTLKQSLNILLFLASDPLQTVRSEVTIMRKDISNELLIAQSELSYVMEIVKGLTEQLHHRCNSEHNAIKLDALAKDYKNLLDNFQIKEEEIIAYKSQDLQLKNELDTKIIELEEQYLNKLSNMKHDYEKQIAEKLEASNELEALNTKLNANNNLLSSQLFDANDKLNKLHVNGIQSLHNEISEKNKVLDLELVTTKDDITKLQNQLFEANKQIETLTADELKVNQTSANDMKGEIGTQRIEIERLNQLVQGLESERELKNIEVQETKQQLLSLATEVTSLRAELVTAKNNNRDKSSSSDPSTDSNVLTSIDSTIVAASTATTMLVSPLLAVELEALKAEYALLQTKLVTESTEHAKLRKEFNSNFEKSQTNNNDVVQNAQLPTDESLHLLKEIESLCMKLTSYNTAASTEDSLKHPNTIFIDTLLNHSKADKLNETPHNISELNTLKVVLEATAIYMNALREHQFIIENDKVVAIESLTNQNNHLKATVDKLSESMSVDSLSVMLPLVNELEELKNNNSKLLKDVDRNKQEAEEKMKLLEVQVSVLSKEKEDLVISLNDTKKVHATLQVTTEEEIKVLKEQLTNITSQQQQQQQQQVATTHATNTTITTGDTIPNPIISTSSPRSGLGLISNGGGSSSAQAIAQYAEKQGLKSMTIQELNFKIFDLQRKLSDSELLLRQSKDMLHKFNMIPHANESNPIIITTTNTNVPIDTNITTNTPTLSENSTTLKSAIELFLSTGKTPRYSLVTNGEGVLKAYPGTTQGSTGWYMNQDQLYYFVVENGKYLLLCGPIHEDVYKLSIDELDKLDVKSDPSISSYPLNLSIDRLGMHATRVQIETLLDDLWHLDDLLKNTVDELYLYKSLVDSNQIESIHEDDGSEVVVNKNSAAFVKLTSLTRGFIIRSRVKKMIANKDAMESGILFAMNNTIQGQSGWYTGPNNQIYYFVLKDGNWVHTLGPIKESEFEKMRSNRKLQHSNKSNKSSNKSEDILYKCDLPLFEAHAELQDHGELYITSSKTASGGKQGGDKLYIAISIDSFMPSLTISDQVSYDDGSIDDLSLYSSSVTNNHYNNSSQILENSISETDYNDNISSIINQEDSEVLFEHFSESPLEQEHPSREQTRPKTMQPISDISTVPISEGDEHIQAIISPPSHEMLVITTDTNT